MPRKVQDIIPADKRTIREIKTLDKKPVSKTKKRVVEEDGEENVPLHKIHNEVEEVEVKDKKSKIEELSGVSISTPKTESIIQRRMPITPPSSEYAPRRKNIWKWPIITLLAVLVVAIIGYFASAFYSQATFTVVPKVIPVTVNSTYVAQYQTSELPYEIITIRKSATSTVPATNGAVTNTKASGKVTFYNYYGTQTVRLIAGTRLTGKNGLLYRLSSSIVVPGYTKSGGAIVPGKIVATITADQPGAQYNLSDSELDTEFKISAYNGSPKYTTIYAKNSAPIVGGFSGVKKVISPSALATSTSKLKSDITASLISDIKSNIPAGYIVYDKNYTTTFTSPVVGGSDPKIANVGIEGTLYAIAFPKTKLVESLAGAQAVAMFSPFNYTTPGLETLDVSITNLKDFGPNKKISLVLKAKGDLKIVGTIPVEELKKKLSGKTLAQSQDIIKSYSPVIESGQGELAPPWADIPSDLNKIKVVVEEP